MELKLNPMFDNAFILSASVASDEILLPSLAGAWGVINHNASPFRPNLDKG